MTTYQVREQGLQAEVETECYSCGCGIKLGRGTVIGEFQDCPSCGVELELREYTPTMEEAHGPIIQADYNNGFIYRSQLTLAQSPEEDEDWGE